MIAISGGNIALLTVLSLGLLQLIGRSSRTAALATLGVLLAHAVVVTAGASVWRATAMAALYLVARLLDARSAPWHALAVAGTLVVCVRPLDVRGVGFLLTCGATAALLAVAPLVRHTTSWHPVLRWCAASAAASLAVEVALLPVNAWAFSRVTSVNGNRKPHICGNRKLHTPGEDVSGGADILPVMPVGRVGLDAGSGATGVQPNTRREAAEPAVTLRLPHAVRPTLSSASADAPASGSCCPGC